jgi:hypothetical protein
MKFWIFILFGIVACRSMDQKPESRIGISKKDTGIFSKLGGKWVYKVGRNSSVFEVLDSSKALLSHNFRRQYKMGKRINDTLWRIEDTVTWGIDSEQRLWMRDSQWRWTFLITKDSLIDIDTTGQWKKVLIRQQ